VYVFDMTDPRTLWLNLTNIGLGVVTLVCLLVIARAVVQELKGRRGRQISAQPDPHALSVQGLGLTMADGGDRIDELKRD
jgi:hypothetical protein